MGLNRAEERSSAFPQIVAWVSLAMALLLFFCNTVPAVRERAELRSTEAELLVLERSYDQALADARTRTPSAHGAGEEDLQALLVAIDRLGFVPAELLAKFPEAPAPSGGPSKGQVATPPDGSAEETRPDSH